MSSRSPLHFVSISAADTQGEGDETEDVDVAAEQLCVAGATLKLNGQRLEGVTHLRLQLRRLV